MGNFCSVPAFAAARNLVHYGIAAPVLTDQQKALARGMDEFRPQQFLKDCITPGTYEWKMEVGLMFHQQLAVWKRQWAARAVTVGCARCHSWVHTARQCYGPPVEIKPFCNECVEFFDSDICRRPHGRARLAAREYCMVCCSVRLRDHRCPKCKRNVTEQLWALPKLPTFTWDQALIQQYRLKEWDGRDKTDTKDLGGEASQGGIFAVLL